MGRIVLAVIGVLALAAGATAQTTTGTISGRVLDTQGLALPGATVTAKSPNLQGTREAVTSENGDYILTGLPSGPYTIAFSLAGFQTQTRNVVLAPTQALPLEVRLGPAQVTEEVTVVASSADTLTDTSQIATNFSQELIANLPTSRDLNSVLLMAPGVHPTGPAGAFSFGGSVSFENLFLLNGVSINENIRGQAFDTAIEDAIQETTVANGGVSAEFGRFSGGVVNIITKSGGNRFSGSFRAVAQQRQMADAGAVRDRASGDDARAPDRQGRPDLRVHDRRPDTARSALVLHLRPLARRVTGTDADRDHGPVRVHGGAAALRGQGHVLTHPETSIPDELQPPRSLADQLQLQPEPDHGHAQPRNATAAGAALCRHVQRHADLEAVRRGARLEADVEFHRRGRQIDRSHRRHPPDRQQPGRRRTVVVRHVLRRLHARGARQRGRLRQGLVLHVHAAIRLAQSGFWLRQLQRHPDGQQSPVGQRLPHPERGRHPHGRGRRRERHLPDLSGRRDHDDSVEPDPPGERGVELPHALGVHQRHVARGESPHGQPRAPLRQERRRRPVWQRCRQGQRVEPTPRSHRGIRPARASGA